MSEKELSQIHNDGVPGEFKSLRINKQKNVKSMGTSDLYLRWMLFKLYVTAHIENQDV